MDLSIEAAISREIEPLRSSNAECSAMHKPHLIDMDAVETEIANVNDGIELGNAARSREADERFLGLDLICRLGT